MCNYQMSWEEIEGIKKAWSTQQNQEKKNTPTNHKNSTKRHQYIGNYNKYNKNWNHPKLDFITRT